MKTAFVFPGQGAQYVGMAQDYLASMPEFAAILKDFDTQHGTSLQQIMAEGPEDILKETRYTQPAILFHSICALRSFQQKSGLKPDFVAGHSLGEFTALTAAGVISWQDAMHIVHKRGEFMIKANAGTPFAMAAVIGPEAEAVIAACQEASSTGLVMAVNFNTPIQTVISGSAEGVSKAGEILKANGAKRVLPLVVGGPFHTPMIKDAADWLKAEMDAVTFSQAAMPVVSNVDAMPETDGNSSREKLVRQIVSPVRWVDCVRYMLQQGVTRFVEFGPQKVLSGMIRTIKSDVEVFSIDKIEDIDAVVSAIR